jgi:hypothetical protein
MGIKIKSWHLGIWRSSTRRSEGVPTRVIHLVGDNQVRLQLFVLAYNLGNFLRQAVLLQAVRHCRCATELRTSLRFTAYIHGM